MILRQPAKGMQTLFAADTAERFSDLRQDNLIPLRLESIEKSLFTNSSNAKRERRRPSNMDGTMVQSLFDNIGTESNLSARQRL